MARFERGSEIREVVLADDREAYCEAQRTLLADGWSRIRDPLREQAYADDPRSAALERAIREDPDDDPTWLVLADFLVQHGHPRGALVALEAAPARTVVERAEREAEARRLRAASAAQLEDGLARTGLSLRWRRGYVHEATLHGTFARGDAEDLVFDLLRHPSTRFLRELVIGCAHRDALDHRLVLALVLHADPRPPLRRLAVGHLGRYIGHPPLGDLGALGTAYPLLEDLELDSDATTSFAGLTLPRARRFALRADDLPPRMLAELARAAWPALEELSLTFGEGSACTAEDVRPLLGALPNVRVLRLRAARFAGALVEVFLAAPIAHQVRLLDLSWAAVDDRAAELLLAARDRLAPGFRCELAGLGDAARRALEDAELLDRW